MWRSVFLLPFLVITDPAAGQDADMTFSEAYAQYQSHVQAGNLDEALPYARLAYELGEKAYGPDHRNTAGLTYNYATTLLETGHYAEAAEILDIAYRRYEKTYGRNAPELIDPLMMQGHAAAIPDQRPNLRFYDRAIRLAQATDDVGLLAALNYDAGVRLTEQAKSLAGHKYLKQAYDIYTDRLGPESTQTLGVAFFLGKVEMGRLNNDAARELLRQVIAGLPPEHRLALTSHGLLVQLSMQDGDAAGIVEHCKAVSHLPKWKQMCGPHAQAPPTTQIEAPGKVTRVGQPRTVFGPPEMAKRRRDQLATAADFKVFHAFGFTDRRPESGITFRHRSVEDTARTYKAVHYDHGNGVSVADVDNDGRLDILFLTQAGENALWRNAGGGKFENITDLAGVGLSDRISVAASFADIDNDGDADLYITVVRAGNRLFENVGGGVFRDITEASGTGHKGHSSAAVFFDYDNDGLLDLFLTNVGEYTSETLREASNGGVDYAFYDGHGDAFAGHLMPERFEQSILYRNAGGHRFVDISAQAGLQDLGWAGDAAAGDLNGDGWTDLYVLNMQGDDRYYQNEKGKRFVNRGREVFPQTSWGAMGIKIFDWNNDGLMDIFITDMHSDMGENIGVAREKDKSEISAAAKVVRGGFGTGGESGEEPRHETSIYGNSFFEQVSPGTYKEVSEAIGAENYWPWGLSAGDINADGFQDVFIASSMNFPFRYGVNSVLLNDNGETFRDAEFILGVEPRRDQRSAVRWFTLDCDDEADAAFWACEGRSGRVEIWGAMGTRASVMFDLDDDGDLDIVTNEFGAEPMVLVNNLTSVSDGTRYLKVRLEGTASNRSGIGARVELTTDHGTYVQVMDGKSGYLSQSSTPLYFGLGKADKIEEIRVLWPSGKEQVVSEPGAMNTLLEIKEPYRREGWHPVRSKRRLSSDAAPPGSKRGCCRPDKRAGAPGRCAGTNCQRVLRATAPACPCRRTGLAAHLRRVGVLAAPVCGQSASNVRGQQENSGP